MIEADDDGQAFAADWPRIAGAGPVEGMAGEVSAALRHYWLFSMAVLREELGEQWDTPAVDLAVGLANQQVERMLAWVDGEVETRSQRTHRPTPRRPSGDRR